MKRKVRLKIGLALGSGGLKGFAHVGVLKILEKNKIPIDYISGSSIGAVIGSLYALSGDAKKVEEAALSKDLEQIFSLVGNPIIDSAMIDETQVHAFLKKYIGTAKFSDTKIPFFATATSAKTGEPVYLNSGTLFRGVRASMAIPPLFSPLKVKNDLLLDGAYSDPVPVRCLRQAGADIVIAINLENDYVFQWKRYRNVYGLSLRSVSIFIRSLATLSAQSADVLIEPSVGGIGWQDIGKAKIIIAKGEKATKFALGKIKEVLGE